MQEEKDEYGVMSKDYLETHKSGYNEEEQDRIERVMMDSNDKSMGDANETDDEDFVDELQRLMTNERENDGGIEMANMNIDFVSDIEDINRNISSQL